MLALMLMGGGAGHAQIGRQSGFEAGTPVTHTGKDHTSSPPVVPPQALHLLPAAFASLPRQGDIVNVSSPVDLDAAHAGVLKEAGFVGASVAHYTGNGPAAWTVQVLRFGDATGAYSAFTFYREPQMQAEPVGDNAAASPGLFLVRTSASLVMVRPSSTAIHPLPDATRLLLPVRNLVQSLPRRRGPDDIAPTLPGLLPSAGLERQTLHYAIGPAAYNGPIPASSIEFNSDAEAVTAAYRLPSGRSAIMTLIMLPTPEIAAAQQHAILALPEAGLHAATRRIGPLLAVVGGAGVSVVEAKALLSQVRYATEVTVDQPQGYISEVAKAAQLLLGIGLLTMFLFLTAVTIAAALGGGRVLIRRLQGKPASSLHDDQFITLKL